MKKAVDIIKRVAGTTKRLEKEEILSEAFATADETQVIQCNDHPDYHNLRLILQYCYDPMITFGVAKKTLDKVESLGKLTVLHEEDLNTFEEFNTVVMQLFHRKLTGKKAIEALQGVYSVVGVDEWKHLYRPTLLKDMRCGMSVQTINKVSQKYTGKNHISKFGCMLAQDGWKKPTKLVGKKIIEKKIDGVRIIAYVVPESNSVTLFTRNGHQNDNFPHIVKEIQEKISTLHPTKPFQLDGEIYFDSFQHTMKQLNRKSDVDTHDAKYAVFDMVEIGESDDVRPYTERLEDIRKILDKANPEFIHMIPGTQLLEFQNEDDAKKRLTEIMASSVNEGYEGLIVKDLDAIYEDKRSDAWLKLKPRETYDLEIVDIIEGTGKYEGMLGAFTCQGIDNEKYIETHVGSGFTDEMRKEFWENKDKLLGDIVEIYGDGLTKSDDHDSYSIRFPVFVRFRTYDKDEGKV